MTVFAGRRVLLLICSVFFLCMIASSLPNQASYSYRSLLLAQAPEQVRVLEPNVARFEFFVNGFETRDKLSMPPPGGTVFVGSSTFAHWKTMEVELKDLSAINRGFGGSTMPEVNHYFERLVTKYKPSRIVLYAGTNDLAEGHSAERVAKDVAAFVAKAHEELPRAEVFFLSMSMAPCRVQFAKEYTEGNRLIAAFTARDSHFHYVDVTKVMYDDNGLLHKDYFGNDNLHMNKAGYAAWVPVIRHALSGSAQANLQ